MTKSLLQAMKNIIKSMNQNAEKCLCPSVPISIISTRWAFAYIVIYDVIMEIS